MQKLKIDMDYVQRVLLDLLAIPSPSGYTDEAVRFAAQELEKLGIPFELTRRGAIRADLKGKHSSPDRAIVAHLDTIGAMVKALKPNGRLEVVPVGSWSSRSAEGARITLFTDERGYRGTIVPLKASGHTYDAEVDTQPIAWSQVEVRLDEFSNNLADLQRLGVHVGDYIAVDPQPEITESGFINSRHLDDKAGVATLLGAARAVLEAGVTLPVDCHILFTISEEVGSGASHVLHQDVAEMVTIDTAPVAPGQNTQETGVTIAIQDSDGPFDYHLTHKLIKLCEEHDIQCHRDVFRYYHSDSASAIEAGNDIRTALLCFGTDATHGWERCHRDTLTSLGELLTLYMQSTPTFMRDRDEMASLEGFSSLPAVSSEPT